MKVTVAGSTINNPPVAIPDIAFVKPNTVDNLIPVLANDQDSDGDDLVLTAPFFTAPPPEAGSVSASDDGKVLIFGAPAEPGSSSFAYYVTDGNHSAVRGIVTVVVDDNAPNRPPVARDDPQDPVKPGDTLLIDVLGK